MRAVDLAAMLVAGGRPRHISYAALAVIAVAGIHWMCVAWVALAWTRGLIGVRNAWSRSRVSAADADIRAAQAREAIAAARESEAHARTTEELYVLTAAAARSKAADIAYEPRVRSCAPRPSSQDDARNAR